MKRVFALVLSATLMFAMVICVPVLAPAEAALPAKELHFVYVSPLLSHPFWLVCKDGFDQACAELGIKGDWVGPQNIAPEEMAKLIETAVVQKADGIITQGLVPAAPLKYAEEADIPVIVVDSDIPDAKRVAYIGKDYDKQAISFLEAAQRVWGEDTPLVVSIQVAALNYKTATDAIECIEKIFAQHPGGFEIVNKHESKSEKMKAATEWQNSFTAYPEINVAISLGDEGGAACGMVVQEMGIKDKVGVFAVGDHEETVDMLRSGAIDATVVCSNFNYGYQAAYWLYQNITEGKTPKEISNDSGTLLVTLDNVDTYHEALKQKVDL